MISYTQFHAQAIAKDPYNNFWFRLHSTTYIFSFYKSHRKITIDTNQFSLKSFKPKICFYIRNIFQFKVNYGNFFPYRAAAYGKIGEHQKAIEDCQKALSLDPNYGKAYGRMG